MGAGTDHVIGAFYDFSICMVTAVAGLRRRALLSPDSDPLARRSFPSPLVPWLLGPVAQRCRSHRQRQVSSENEAEKISLPAHLRTPHIVSPYGVDT